MADKDKRDEMTPDPKYHEETMMMVAGHLAENNVNGCVIVLDMKEVDDTWCVKEIDFIENLTSTYGIEETIKFVDYLIEHHHKHGRNQ